MRLQRDFVQPQCSFPIMHQRSLPGGLPFGPNTIPCWLAAAYSVSRACVIVPLIRFFVSLLLFLGPFFLFFYYIVLFFRGSFLHDFVQAETHVY